MQQMAVFLSQLLQMEARLVAPYLGTLFVHDRCYCSLFSDLLFVDRRYIIVFPHGLFLFVFTDFWKRRLKKPLGRQLQRENRHDRDRVLPRNLLA